MSINLIGYGLFWKIIGECRLTLPELCRLQRVSRLWRRLLCPSPQHSVFWDEVFGAYSSHDMAEQTMSALHPGIRGLNYHGSELAVVWLKREQIQLEARLQLHRAWLRTRGKFRQLSEIARAIIYSETVWVCMNCRQLWHGPKTPDENPDCCRHSKLRNATFYPHKSNLLALNESSVCARCGIYGRRPKSKYCLFCSK